MPQDPATAAQPSPAPELAPPPSGPHRAGDEARGPDPLALLAGIAALVVAALALTGSLDTVDPRWVVAGAAIAVGIAVLLTTLVRRSR